MSKYRTASCAGSYTVCVVSLGKPMTARFVKDCDASLTIGEALQLCEFRGIPCSIRINTKEQLIIDGSTEVIRSLVLNPTDNRAFLHKCYKSISLVYKPSETIEDLAMRFVKRREAVRCFPANNAAPKYDNSIRYVDPVNFTRHARFVMHERGFSVSAIESVINTGESVVSRKADPVLKHRKDGIEVITTVQDGCRKVITTYRVDSNKDPLKGLRIGPLRPTKPKTNTKPELTMDDPFDWSFVIPKRIENSSKI